MADAILPLFEESGDDYSLVLVAYLSATGKQIVCVAINDDSVAVSSRPANNSSMTANRAGCASALKSLALIS